MKNQEWRPRLNAQNTGIVEGKQQAQRDTSGLYGPIEVNGLHDPLGHNNPPPKIENAVTSAKVNGVKTIAALKKAHTKHTPKQKRSAMSLYGKDAHKRVAKCIGYALTDGTTAAWSKLLIVLVARLSEKERVQLAWASLSSCTDDQAYRIASSILYPHNVGGRA